MIEISEILKYLIPSVIAIVTWFAKDKILHSLNIKLKRVDVEEARYKSLQTVLDLYQEMVVDMNEKNKSQLVDFETELVRFRELIGEMTKTIEDQKDYIAQQTATLKKYINKFGKLNS